MAYISKIKIGENTYDIAADLSNLGDLAYKDSASGTVTAAGSVSAPSINLTSTVKTASKTTGGTLPTWSASVTNETLEFAFNAGALPTSTDVTVHDVTAASLSGAPAFTGTPVSVTVS